MLTFTTGLVDAVSYLGLGRVFTANMTGNIVFLGFGIAGSGGLPVVAPLVSLARSFWAQAAVASSRGGWETAILCISLARSSSRSPYRRGGDRRGGGHIRPNAVSGDTVIALLALAMGVRNATIGGSACPI